MPRYRITEEGRECGKCNQFLPWKEFSKSKSGAQGYQSQCKTCWSNTHTRKHTTVSTIERDNQRLVTEMLRRETMTDEQLRQEYLQRKAQWRKEWDAINWEELKLKVQIELLFED